MVDSSQKAGVATRIAAAKAVQAVLADKIPLEQALVDHRGYKALSSRDRAFARLLVATVFRRMGQIDAVLKPFIKRKPAPFVVAVLRIGTAQLLFLGTPIHAAVGETVEVLKASKKNQNYAGMVNAVLRRVSEKGQIFLAKEAPRVNIPGWLRNSWEKEYGSPAMRRMATQLQKDPPLDLTVKSDPQMWAEKLDGEVLPNGTVRLEKIGDVTKLDGFEAGEWWAQDIAASLPVKILGDIKGLRVLDMCAAPGGKTLQLATGGAEVTALDRSEDRMVRVRENLERTKLEANVIVADATDWVPETADFDIVLLDAPCSATGTMRRHPDVLYNKTASDVAKLVKIQDKLLAAAALLVKPGGTLIYCTCSLQPDEGEARIEKFLKNWTDFRLNPILTILRLTNLKDV